MKEIQLSKQGKNKGKYVALVDDEDFERVNQFRWSVCAHRSTFYAVRNMPINGEITPRRMHQFIMGLRYIDHENHNGLHNYKSNLRPCTNSQNNMNQLPRKNCSSKYKGVYRNKERNKWIAQIRINDKTFNLGSFTDEIKAAKAYNNKAKELFGEFACLNLTN